MRIRIELKADDAEGAGGQALIELGLRRLASEPTTFVGRVSIDPNWDGVITTQGALWPYYEALRDVGVRPRRVLPIIMDNGTPLTAAVQAPTRAESGLLIAQRALSRAVALLSE